MTAPRCVLSTITITLLCWLIQWKPCQGETLDELISKAMKSPSGYGFMYDEASGIVKVDLDMVFTLDDWNELVSLNDSYQYYGPFPWSNGKRQAIRERPGTKRWPYGVVPYEIDSYAFRNPTERQVLFDAMNDWMYYTCVRFVPAKPTDVNRIRFVDGDGCSSNVGMVDKAQEVTLGQGCRMKGIAIHELGHVLGFHHEHKRPDRDQYVRIRYENIGDNMEYNFKKLSWAVITDLGVPYDYLSVMHYGSKSFSSNGRATIETLDPSYQNLIGNRAGLSFRDIKSTNLFYECRPVNCHLTDRDCPGEGFVSKNCECWCPSAQPYGPNPYVVCQPGGTGGPNSPVAPCADQNQHCRYWATVGECNKNAFYMNEYCKRSCGRCGVSAPSCADQYASSTCLYWRNQGYCRVGSAFSSFMATNCKMTCGFCQIYNYLGGGLQLSEPEGSTLSPSTTPDSPRSCQDTELEGACRAWKEEGECEASRDKMATRCARTCNLCTNLLTN